MSQSNGGNDREIGRFPETFQAGKFMNSAVKMFLKYSVALGDLC